MAPPPVSHRITAAADGAPILVKRSTDADGRARLAGEAAVLRALAHPDLVRVVDLRDDGTTAELHLAWVGPHSLATVTSVPVPDAGRLVARVAEVVDDLHRAGVAHGRLTPDHVLLGADGAPVLTGLAEAVGGGRADHDGDVAALGALLTSLVRPADDPPMIPERRHRRPADTGVRAALLTAADLAAGDTDARPTARQLADQIRSALGDGRSGHLHRRRRRRTPPGRDGWPRDERRTPRPPTSEPGRAAAPSTTPESPGQVPHGVGASRPEGGAADPLPTPTPASRPRALPARRRRHRSAPARPRRTGPALRRRWAEVPPGRRVAVAVLVLAVGGTLAAVGARGAQHRPDAAGPAAPSTTRPPAPADPAPADAPQTSGPQVGPPPAPDPTPSDLAGCPPVAAARAADVDGDGCPDALRIEDERVTADGTTWVVGRQGDTLAVGDWDCDGTATVASLRPSTGEVFVFDRWATPGAELTVPAATTVAGAQGLEALDADGDGCAALTATRAHGRSVEVAVGRR